MLLFPLDELLKFARHDREARRLMRKRKPRNMRRSRTHRSHQFLRLQKASSDPLRILMLMVSRMEQRRTVQPKKQRCHNTLLAWRLSDG